MKKFELIKLNNSEYDYMVIADTYIRPISTKQARLTLGERTGRRWDLLQYVEEAASGRFGAC